MMDESNSDRRSLYRHRCVIAVQIYVPGWPAVECSMRDLTLDGACLVLPATAPTVLPAKISLLLPGIGALWVARVRWRSGGVVGVSFMRDNVDKAASAAAKYPDIFALRVQVADLARDFCAANSNLRDQGRPKRAMR